MEDATGQTETARAAAGRRELLVLPWDRPHTPLSPDKEFDPSWWSMSSVIWDYKS